MTDSNMTVSKHPATNTSSYPAKTPVCILLHFLLSATGTVDCVIFAAASHHFIVITGIHQCLSASPAMPCPRLSLPLPELFLNAAMPAL